jgi:hypothetical protein
MTCAGRCPGPVNPKTDENASAGRDSTAKRSPVALLPTGQEDDGEPDRTKKLAELLVSWRGAVKAQMPTPDRIYKEVRLNEWMAVGGE